jgi:hypothetical protein
MDEVIIEYMVFCKYVIAYKEDICVAIFNNFINRSLGILVFLKVDTMSDPSKT